MANAFMTGAVGTEAVRAFAQAERQRLLDQARVLDEIIKDLAPLDLAEAQSPAPPASRPKPPPAPPKPKPKGGGSRPSANQMAKEAVGRRKKIVGLLLERGEAMSPQAIKAVIPMSQSQATSDFKKLTLAGDIRRHGPVTNPTYEAVIKPSTGPPPSPTGRAGQREPSRDGDGSTKGGRILGYITSTGGATEAALAEHLGLTIDDVRDECGTLIREGEIRHDRSGGITRYILDPSA